MPPKRHSNLSSTACSCNKCAKSFSSGAALADHSRSTGHLLPCTTSGCTKAFTSQQALEQHVNSSVHKDTRSNQLQGLTQQIHTTPVRKEPGKSTQTACIASSNISMMNNTPDHSDISRVSHETVKIPATTVAGSFLSNIYKGSFEATKMPATYPVSMVQKAPHMFNECKRPSQSRSVTELSWESPSLVLPPNEMPQPVRNASLYGFYAPYDINDCYLVVTLAVAGNPLFLH